MNIPLRCWFFFTAAVVFPAAAAEKNQAPAWARELRQDPGALAVKTDDALVLFKEGKIELGANARSVESMRYAVKILTDAGRRHALAVVGYTPDTQRIRNFQAWLILPDGRTLSLGKKEAIDGAALATRSLFSDGKFRAIDARAMAAVGAVFVYEWTLEGERWSWNLPWHFQDENPTLLSRLILTIPPGWSLSALPFNHGTMRPSVVGHTSTWELADLPGTRGEALAPSTANLTPGIGIDLVPPPGVKAVARIFPSWESVGRFVNETSDPQCLSDDAIQQKAVALTAGLATDWEKARAIAQYVQSLKYTTIQEDLGQGGGMRPRAAALIFRTGYGDCKDKTNLARAMLKCAGIESHPVIAYLGDPHHVQPGWASPAQFNHEILAISIDERWPYRTHLEEERFGALLIFDPTDQGTFFGQIPPVLQGSWVLLAGFGDGRLVKIPIEEPETAFTERTVHAVLTAQELKAQILQIDRGGHASSARGRYLFQTRSDYRKGMERWLSETMTGVTLLSFEPDNLAENAAFSLKLETSVPRYAEITSGGLLMFRPVLVERTELKTPSEPARRYPVALKEKAVLDRTQIVLPAGFAIDGLPANARFEQPFGSYDLSFEVKEDVLHVTRKLVVKRSYLPAKDYPTVKKFFDDIRRVEMARMIMKKVPAAVAVR